MSTKYWENEQPTILSTEKNEVRVYREAGKVQVFPKVANTARGIGKGATIDLASMTVEELVALDALLQDAIQQQLTMEPA